MEIAKAWGDQNFRLIKRAVKLIPGTKTGAIWPALKAIGKERNLIGHGVWLWTSEERPLVIWHSKFLEDAEWVGAEFFDYTRFDYFMRRAFANFKLFIVKAIDAEKVARAAGKEPTAGSVAPWWRTAKFATNAGPKHSHSVAMKQRPIRKKKLGPRRAPSPARGRTRSSRH
jgi:hypothetical protein